MPRRALLLPAAIVVTTVVAAVVVLLAGGTQRVGLAMILLIGMPLLIAMGGGSDAGWQADPSDPRPALRLLAFLPALLAQLALLGVVVWQAVVAVADGSAVCVVVLVPVVLYAVWRTVRTSGRLRA